MNRYTVRISVTQRKRMPGLAGIAGSETPDKLLDASVTTDDLVQVRSIVDGLIFEAIPDTQRPDEKEDPETDTPRRRLPPDVYAGEAEPTIGAGYRLPPTVAESGDLDAKDVYAVKRPGVDRCENPVECDIHGHEVSDADQERDPRDVAPGY